MKKLENYRSNLRILEQADRQDLSNRFVLNGIISMFSIQFELGWKVLKELLQYEGAAIAGTGSPREIIKAAYRCYPFIDQELWLSMLAERNSMAHIYDGEASAELVQRILHRYIPAFQSMETRITEMYG